MAEVGIERLHKSFADTAVLNDISMQIRHGEFMVFVGPSGCGKTTLLRSIAGLEKPSAGRVTIGGDDVTRWPPARRGVSMVFQSYALYPHMTVRENIAFGLKVAKVPKDDIAGRVRDAAAILQIEHLLDRRPKELSGGQRQRVVIGRPASARRHRAVHRPPAEGFPFRRTPVEPRRRVARADVRRACRPARPAGRHDDLRDA